MQLENTFAVSPPAQRLNGRPGDTIEGVVWVNNYASSKYDLEYTTSVLPYGVDGRTYHDDFVTRTERNIATEWVTIVESAGIVPPNKSKDIHFRIAIPEDAPGGGQYFIIAVGNSESANPDAHVKDTAEIASVIYLNVDGEVIREGSVLENSIPFISFTTPIITTASFRNTGNTHLDAILYATATNVFTREEVFPEEEGATKSTLVLPGAEKSISERITQLDSIGIYDITQTISYNGETYTTSHLSIVCPAWIFVIFLASLITAIFVIVKKIITRRRKHSYFSI